MNITWRLLLNTIKFCLSFPHLLLPVKVNYARQLLHRTMGRESRNRWAPLHDVMPVWAVNGRGWVVSGESLSQHWLLELPRAVKARAQYEHHCPGLSLSARRGDDVPLSWVQGLWQIPTWQHLKSVSKDPLRADSHGGLGSTRRRLRRLLSIKCLITLCKQGF